MSAQGSGETRLSDQIASLRRFAGTTLYRFNTIDFEYEVVQIDLGALLDVAQTVEDYIGTTYAEKDKALIAMKRARDALSQRMEERPVPAQPEEAP